MFGAAAFLFPLLIFLLSWKWIRSEELQAGGVKIFGAILLTLALSAALLLRPLPPLRRHHPHRRHPRTPARHLPGRFAQRDRRARRHAHRHHRLDLPGLHLHAGQARRLVRRPAAWFAARAAAWRAWRERVHQRAIEKARARAAARRALPCARNRETAATRARRRARARRRPHHPRSCRCPPKSMAAPPGSRRRSSPPSTPASRSPRRSTAITPPSRRSPSARSKTTRRPPRNSSPRSLPAKDDTRATAPHRPRLPPAAHRLPQRTARAQSLRRAGTQGHRRPHQGQVRRVQRPRQRGADQPRPGGHHFRVQARSRHQVQPHHQPHRRPVPGPAGRIHPDRAHPRQADRRHRGAQHASAR